MKLIIVVIATLCLSQSSGYAVHHGTNHGKDRTAAKLQDEPALRGKPVNCLFCESAMLAAEKLVLANVTSEQQLVKEIAGLCEKLTNGSSVCVGAAIAIAQQLWKYKNFPPEKACQTFKLCPKTTLKGVVGGSKAGNNSFTCSVCKDAVSALKLLVIAEQGNIENEIVTVFCDHLPSDPAKACESAIKEDFPDIVEKLLNSGLICGLLKVC